MDTFIGFILWIGIAAFGVWLTLVIPPQMAIRRNRNPYVWFFFTILFSPLLTIPLLLLMGKVTLLDEANS